MLPLAALSRTLTMAGEADAALTEYASCFVEAVANRLLPDPSFCTALEAACQRHPHLNFLTFPGNLSFVEKMRRHLHKMSSLNSRAWKAVVEWWQTQQGLRADQLAALFVYTLNLPPVFMILHVAARLEDNPLQRVLEQTLPRGMPRSLSCRRQRSRWERC